MSDQPKPKDDLAAYRNLPKNWRVVSIPLPKPRTKLLDY